MKNPKRAGAIDSVGNMPWSGKLGRVTKCCLYCGDDGPAFELSSHATACGKCAGRCAVPIPALWKQFLADLEKAARDWCHDNGIDYDTAMKIVDK